MTQFLRDQASDSEEVVTPLMLDGTYLSRNFATLGPLTSQPPCEDEPTWRCQQNPFIGALGIQEPVIPGEPLIKRQPMIIGE